MIVVVFKYTLTVTCFHNIKVVVKCLVECVVRKVWLYGNDNSLS